MVFGGAQRFFEAFSVGEKFKLLWIILELV